MIRLALRSLPLLLLCGLVLDLPAVQLKAAASPVQELRTQKVGDLTYFHVRVELPRDMLPDLQRFNRGWFAEPSPSLAPRLISGDGQLRLVCERFDPNARNRNQFDTPPVEPAQQKQPPGQARQPRRPVPVQGLEFVGRTDAKGEVKVKLLYPIEGKRPRIIGRLSRTPPPPAWKEMDLVLDFGSAKAVAVPQEAAERKEEPKQDGVWFRNPPVRDDLEGLWAVAQVGQFLDLDNEVTEFGFYGFAATATARKYGVRISQRLGALMEPLSEPPRRRRRPVRQSRAL